MFNSKILLASFCLVLSALLNFTFAQSAKKVSFSFTLNSAATTSAGVYKKDGTLLRTLWGGVKYKAGTFTQDWDSKDDYGNNIFDTSLVYKVLSNNVTYNWDGVIGNNSTNFTGPGIFHGYDLIKSMAIDGDDAYMGIGYNEAWPSKQKISLKKPNFQHSVLYSGQGTAQRTSYVATDGENVFWAENDPFSSTDDNNSKGFKWFVIATKTANDQQKLFPAGQLVKSTYGLSFSSAIDVMDNNQSSLGNIRAITGLAVQNSGKFLFVAHGAMNKLHVFDKNTGVLLNALSLNNPREVNVDDNDNLWMITENNTVARYRINSNGSLQPASLVLTGLVKALTLATSVDGKLVAVLDGGASQQVKAFNTSTGTKLWALGQPGGYADNATVANDKFMFGEKSFIAFQKDGSFWFSDEGNNRYQHFSASLSYLENIAYLPVTYCISVDENNPTRVFAGFLEFALDYSKPLAPNNGSWKLVKNWAYNAPANADRFESLKTTFTLKNGLTYSVVRDGINNMELVELVNGGNLRRTGLTYPPDYWLTADGSLQKQWAPHYSGGYSVWVKKPLSGFDGSNNPIWGKEYELDRVAINDGDPAYRGQGPTYKPSELTTSGVRPNFDGGNKNIPFHLAGVKNGKMIWKTARSTHYDYNGAFPNNGDFDIGNGVNDFAGSNAMAIDRSIFWGYHGEFWKGGQTNVYNHVYDNGLLIGHFGTSEGAYKEGFPAMAGNAFSTKIVKVEDDYYLFNNDESYHSGIHRFKISGLNTIEEQSIPVRNQAEAVGNPNEIDLMAGLPFKKVLEDGTNGWNRTVKTETSYFNAKTSIKTYNPANGDDIFMNYSEGKGNVNVTRDLGTNQGLDGWKLSGNITWAGGMPNHTKGGGGVFLEVLDDAGKVITRFCYTTNYGTDATHIKGNDVDITSGEIDYIQNEVVKKMLPIEISASKGIFTFKYADFAEVTTKTLPDGGANWQNPKTMRIKFVQDKTVHVAKSIDVANMKFEKIKGLTQVVVGDKPDDLMLGLPYKSVMPDRIKGWRRSSPDNNYNFTATTSHTTENTDNGDDIYVEFKEGGGNFNITRELGSNVNLTDWKLTGNVTWAGSVPNYTNGKGGIFLEVLDNEGRAISRFYYTTNYGTNPTRIKGNEKDILTGDINFVQNNIASKLLPLEISAAKGIISFKYGSFDLVSTSNLADVDANWKNPQTLRVKFIEDNVLHFNKSFDFANMKFAKTAEVPVDVIPVASENNDLMKGLPVKSVLLDGTNGWNRSGKTETTFFSAKTSVTTNNSANGDDVFMEFKEGAGNFNVTRDLGTNAGVSGWKLSGKISWQQGIPNYTNGGGGVYLEVLDAKSKVITRFYYTTNYGADATHIVGNNLEIYSADISQVQYNIAGKLQPLEISVTNGTVTFKYAGLTEKSTTTLVDASADWTSPKTLRINFIEDKVIKNVKSFDVANMQFITTGTTPPQQVISPANNNLMDGLPYKNVLIDNAKGWNRSMKAESVYFTAKTSITTTNKNNGDDIYMEFKEGGGNASVTRDLGKNIALTDWKIAGDISWMGNPPNYTNGGGGVFFEILDNVNKVISKVYFTTNFSNDPSHIYANDVELTSGDINTMQNKIAGKLLPLEISASGNKLTFKYGTFAAVSTTMLAESGANMQNPTTLRVNFIEDRVVRIGKTFDIANMQFTTTTTNTITPEPVIVIVPPSDSKADDLMKGLPYKAAVANNTFGWFRNGAESPYFSARTSIKTDNTDNGDDIFMKFKEGAGNFNVTRDLGKNTSLSEWKLSGKVTWAGSIPNYTNGKSGVFLEVLDKADRVITSFYYTTNYFGDATHIKGNNVDIVAGDIDDLQNNVAAKLLPLEISAKNGLLTFSYGDYQAVTTKQAYDDLADWQSPKTLRVNFIEDYLLRFGKQFDIANMRFTAIGGTVNTAAKASKLSTTTPAANPLPQVNRTANALAEGFSLFPNPVTGNTINIKLANTFTGAYMVKCINESGKVLFTKSFYNNNKNVVNTLTLDNKLVPGIYFVQLIQGDKRYVQTFIKQ